MFVHPIRTSSVASYTSDYSFPYLSSLSLTAYLRRWLVQSTSHCHRLCITRREPNNVCGVVCWNLNMEENRSRILHQSSLGCLDVQHRILYLGNVFSTDKTRGSNSLPLWCCLFAWASSFLCVSTCPYVLHWSDPVTAFWTSAAYGRSSASSVSASALIPSRKWDIGFYSML